MTAFPINDATLLALTNAIERLSTSLSGGAGPEVPVMAGEYSRFIWRRGKLVPIDAAPLPLDMLLGVDRQKERLLANVLQFASGLPANHAMLWGAPGTGKSALAKAVHAQALASHSDLAIVEVSRDDVGSIGPLLEGLDRGSRRVLLFIDDLSFSPTDLAYRTLKTVLDGGIAAKPGTGRVLVLVTSNLRHLIDRDAAQSLQNRSQRPDEAAFEQLALSDRFGLWLGFHPMDQDTYLAVVRTYCRRFDLLPKDAGLDRLALQWAQMRGSRSGRAAWQFVTDRAGQLGKELQF